MKELEVFVESSCLRESGAFRPNPTTPQQGAPHVAPAAGTGGKARPRPKGCDTARTFAKKRGDVSREGGEKAGYGPHWQPARETTGLQASVRRYAVRVRRTGPAGADERRFRRASAITSAIESFQIFAAARVSAGSAWL